MKSKRLVFSLSVLLLAGCASAPPVSVTTEKKKGVTIIHHRSRTSSGLVDKIEAIDAKGAVSQAEVHVYDVGRYVDGSGNIHEAHAVYRTVQSSRPNLTLPKTVSGGPRSSYAPPNYVPPSNDQRVNDAVAAANQAKAKFEAAEKQMQDRLNQDNGLAQQLETQKEQNRQLQAQINASTTAHPFTIPPTAAQDAASNSVDQLKAWGQQNQ